MKRLFLLSLLLLAGCSSQGTYATRLKLTTLPTPVALAPIPEVQSKEMQTAIDQINNALTPSQADLAVSQVRMANTFMSGVSMMTNPKDTPQIVEARKKVNAEVMQMSAYFEQAAQIKRAQLENGDSSDSTGEVAALLEQFKQSGNNCIYLSKSLPPLY